MTYATAVIIVGTILTARVNANSTGPMAVDYLMALRTAKDSFSTGQSPSLPKGERGKYEIQVLAFN
jgi:hypothetical protein